MPLWPSHNDCDAGGADTAMMERQVGYVLASFYSERESILRANHIGSPQH